MQFVSPNQTRDAKKMLKKKRKQRAKNAKRIKIENGALVAGTIEGIVQYLLDHVPYDKRNEEIIIESDEEEGTIVRRKVDPSISELEMFIISYRQFVSPTDFFDILEDRFVTDTSDQSRHAVLKMLTVWLEKYLDRDFFFHDKGNRLFDQLLKFIKMMEENKYEAPSNRLKLLILRNRKQNRRRTMSDVSGIERLRTGLSDPEANGKRFSLCEMPLIELAEQMTLIERNMFVAIREREFLNLNWKKPANKRNSRHIVKMVDRFNKVSYWVATRIVRENDLKRRTSLLKRFIILAEKCAELNNYNTLMEVLAGLNLHPVQRLKGTWRGLSEKYKDSMNNMLQIMENKANYKNYRERLNKVRATPGESSLPYLGVYLRDLTFVEEGNNTYSEDNLINYDKIQLVGQVIREVQWFQENCKYSGMELSTVPTTIKYLKKLRGLNEEQLTARSRECEAVVVNQPIPDGV
eukprot:CAMPEP_0174260506 /NCGR_PEP_ID=MMETSP0439-20130205/9795_1 /TAXON_ID=0 /ORGANISM="Stereomyxa ramosa, Strain Chinc5" /LENGTH=463 /DNA_ID=CAMNT_0015344761 /DNA_START=92 /DNA_END=1483 /DNA_ORIENTATION=+